MAANKRDVQTNEKREKSTRNSFQRHPALYVFSVFILVVILVTFIGAPAISGSASRSQLSFGRYDGVEIAYQSGNYFARQYESIAQSLRDAGEGTNLELQLRLAWREAFNRTVLHTAVLQSAEEIGTRVSETRIDEMLAQSAQFQENGRFSPELYGSLSSQEKYNLRKYYRETALFEQVVTDVLTGAKVSDAESSFVAAMAGPERSFQVVRFPFSNYPDEEVISFATENDRLFTTLELQIITLPSEEQASEVLSQANSGSPVEDLARTYSKDVYADQGGIMGSVSGYDVERFLTNADDLTTILALSEGESTNPIEVVGGWALFTALSGAEPFNPTDADALNQAREYVEIYEQGHIQDYARESANEFVVAARESSLAEAASVAGLDLYETPSFPINYGNVPIFGRIQSDDIPDLADAAYNTEFLEAAFSLKEGEVGDALILRDSAVVLSLLEKSDVPEENTGFIAQYYPYLTQQFQSEEVDGAFIDREKLEDNFVQSFSEYILGNG